MVNLHFSLLPRWRGAAPVERAILAGDEKTGVCLMALDEGLDTGPVYARVETPILPHENADELRARLAELGTAVLLERLHGGIATLGTPVPQAGEAALRGEDRPRRAADRMAAPRCRARPARAGRACLDDVPRQAPDRRARPGRGGPAPGADSGGPGRRCGDGRRRARGARAGQLGRRRGGLRPGPPRAARGQARGARRPCLSRRGGGGRDRRRASVSARSRPAAGGWLRWSRGRSRRTGSRARSSFVGAW